MQSLLRTLAAVLAAIYQHLFGQPSPPGHWTPPVLDEAEAFESRLIRVLPAGWTVDRRERRPWYRPLPRSSQPYLTDWDRSWVLSTPWPGHEPQRAQVHLHLVRDADSLPPSKETLARWERFTVVAQDPAVMEIDNDSFAWHTLPGWPTARADLVTALA